MDLDLNDLVKRGGAKPTSIHMLEVGEIGEGDIPTLQAERDSKAPPRKKMRYRHHTLAKALATGATPGTAAILAGFTLPTVSILQNDPAFKELIAFYSQDANKTFDLINEKKLGITSQALDLVAERFAKEPEKIKTDTAWSIAREGLDRSGHAPRAQAQTEVHIHANFAEKLKIAREAAPAPTPQVIDGTFEVVKDE